MQQEDRDLLADLLNVRFTGRWYPWSRGLVNRFSAFVETHGPSTVHGSWDLALQFFVQESFKDDSG